MQFIDRIDAIEKTAADLGLSLAQLCRAAQVPYSTVWRWRTGVTSPLVKTVGEVIDRLEAALTARRSSLRVALRETRSTSRSAP